MRSGTAVPAGPNHHLLATDKGIQLARNDTGHPVALLPPGALMATAYDLAAKDDEQRSNDQ